MFKFRMVHFFSGLSLSLYGRRAAFLCENHNEP